MSLELRPGAIIHYPYLWRWQRDRGETGGRKERPVCVAIAARGRDNLTHLALLAISSRPPSEDQAALEVPEIERRRAGLSEWQRAWITVSEYNYDIAERSWHLDLSQAPLGRFSKPFLIRLSSSLAPLFRTAQARVDRTE
ncbi:MAG: hypothetical protein JO288_06425 [Hyphomicrobiales bacterium]|nr:hypothetical protein [Hyphomicrobiales bacterium]